MVGIPRLFAVTGRPILHSRSPQVFTAAYRAGGMDATYTRLAADSAPHALELARALGLNGLNVSAPFKVPMLTCVEAGDDTSTSVGAVNVVRFEPDGRATGFNTDPAGVSAMLDGVGTGVEGRRAVVLGAGGAARAAVSTLVQRGAADVVIVNRASGRGRQAAAELACRHEPWDRAEDALDAAHLIVSCLPLGVVHPGVAPRNSSAVVFDANYVPGRILEGAHGGGAWLLGQAEEGFARLTGQPVDPPAMFRTMAAGDGPPPGHRIALAGMMGTGKSAVGRALAQQLGAPLLDVDDLVEEAAGTSIKTLFATRGEAEFRSQESAALDRALQAETAVIALGGGALESAANRAAVRGRCRVIWLWADARTCASRISGDSRPLLQVDDPLAALEELLVRRRPRYAAAADLIVDAREGTPEQIASRILEELG